MPRDASGNYTKPLPDVVAGTVITPIWANTTIDDLAQAMTDSLSRSGQGAMTSVMKLVDGTAPSPGLQWGNEASSGLYRAGNGDVRMSVLTQDVMRWQSTGSSVWNATTAEWDAISSVAAGTVTNQMLRWNNTTKRWAAGSTLSGVDFAGNIGIGTITPLAGLHLVETGIRIDKVDGPNTVWAETGSADLNARVLLDDGFWQLQRLDDALGYMTDAFVVNLAGATGLYFNGVLKASTTFNGIQLTNGITNPFDGSIHTGLIQNDTVGAALSFGQTFQHVGVEVGSIRWTNAATTFATSCDPRVKTSYGPYSQEAAINTVRALQVHDAVFKVNPADRAAMFMSTEVEVVVPEAVVGEAGATNEDGSVKPQGMENGKLIPYLTVALQNALDRIEALEA
jgi:hypothetical protein